jgi:amino acid transporter
MLKTTRYQYSITLCAEISAAALVINYWDQEEKYNPAIWITLIILLILGLNIFAVGIYGEAEFIFASIKIITMCGLLLLGLIIMLGGAPDHDRRGFR